MRSGRSVLVVAALLLLSACSSSSDKQGAGKTASPGASATTSSAPSTNPIASGSPNASPSATPSVVDRPCDPVTIYSSNAGVPGGNYIKAATRPTRQWGPKCEILNPGDKCEVGWDGAYSLVAGDAYLSFQAWSKGESKPFKEITPGPLPGQNSFRRAGFPVTIPAKATEVAFRIVLMDQLKTPVAISDAYSYRVNCRAGS